MDGSEKKYNESIDRKILDEYVQSIQQPRLPVEFECKMDYIGFQEEGDIEVPLAITNNLGQAVWVGKYIY
jgi:hypothetical protein